MMPENKKPNIAVVTDSSTGWTEAEGQKHGIYVLSLMINFNDGSSYHDNQIEISDDEFYHQIIDEKNWAKTSQTPIGEMETTFLELLKTHDQIVFLPIAKNLSGQYNTALALAKRKEFTGRLHVLDTNGAVEVLKHMSLAIRKAIDEGELDPRKWHRIIQKIYDNSGIYLFPYNLNMLLKGGRNQNVLGSLVTLLHIKLVIKFRDVPKRLAVGRTLNRLIKAAVRDLKQNLNVAQSKLTLLLTTNIKKKTVWLVESMLKEAGLTYETGRIPLIYAAHTGNNSFCLTACPKTFD